MKILNFKFTKNQIYRRDRKERGGNPSRFLTIFSAPSASSAVKRFIYGAINLQCLSVALCLTTAGTSHAGAWQWIDGSRVQNMLREGSGLWFIDVRNSRAYESLHIEGSVNIPAESLVHKQFPASKMIVLVDDSLGQKQAREGADALAQKGHEKVYVLEGGIASWKLDGRQIVENASVVRGVTVLELKWAIEHAVPLRIFDMRSAEEMKKGVIESHAYSVVQGNTVQERIEALKNILKKDEGKDLFSRLKKPQPAVIVFSASEDAETHTRLVLRDAAGDVQYLIGGYEAFISDTIRGVQVTGTCPTCPGKVQ